MPEVLRRFRERRTGKDRRRFFSLDRFLYRGPEKRKASKDRRSQGERRRDWIRTGKWSSVNMHNLKISKYLE
jgi:hypothetical protein